MVWQQQRNSSLSKDENCSLFCILTFSTGRAAGRHPRSIVMSVWIVCTQPKSLVFVWIRKEVSFSPMNDPRGHRDVVSNLVVSRWKNPSYCPKKVLFHHLKSSSGECVCDLLRSESRFCKFSKPEYTRH